MGAVVDTSVLIELERNPSAATRLPEGRRFVALVSLAELQVGVEYAQGTARGQRASFFDLVNREFEVVMPSIEIAKRVGRISYLLRTGGKLVGAHDIWIAATAMMLGEPVLTADVHSFQRVDGLTVLPWSPTEK